MPSAAASALRRIAALTLLVAATVLGGCAMGIHSRDPLEPLNRKVMQFNEGVDAVALKPTATFYREKVPPLVRTGVSNFFGNLSDAWSFVNSVLQFKIHNAADNFARVQLNTLFGLGGIFDLASEFNIDRHREDFGQTLGHWGMPAGPYIVLPLLGPSTLRDTIALPVDRELDPLHHLDPLGARGSLYVLRVVDVRANLLRASAVLDDVALDKYSFTRDAYLQRRRAQIRENVQSDSDGHEPRSEGQIPALPADTSGTAAEPGEKPVP